MQKNEENEEMVERLRATGVLRTSYIIEAFRHVPRSIFVPDRFKRFAYEDIALPFAKSATISQPSIVAYMLEELMPTPNCRVLEIGTGSGWLASLIGYCIAKGAIYTLEIDSGVAKMARENIEKTGLSNIMIIEHDGSGGYPEKAPYDRIIYSGAMPSVPDVVIGQMKSRSRLVAPIGDEYSQKLVTLEKSGKRLKRREGPSVLFSPIVGRFGFAMA
ncbi:MAG: protein-L-isoaspartate(D-aspartate) O-methyltransferase [Candidatus Micrarchaeia archaeon]